MPEEEDDEVADDTKAPEEPRSKKLFAHPAAITVLAAIVGLLTGLVTTYLTNTQTVSQYWRDKRLEVYSKYFHDARSVDNVTIRMSLIIEDLKSEGNVVGSPSKDLTEEINVNYDTFEKSLVTMRNSQQAVDLIAGSEVRSAVMQHSTQLAHVSAAYSRVLLQVRGSAHGVDEALVTDLDEQLREADYDELAKVQNALRDELGIR